MIVASSPRSLRAALVVLAGVVVVVVVAWSLKGGEGRSPAVPEIRGVTKLADDFSSRSGWVTFSSEPTEFRYDPGGYRLRLSRPGDDAVSAVLLPGEGWRSVAATASVDTASPTAGLIGVGCAAGENRGYLGAVDPATGGLVILRSARSGFALLRSGATDHGTVRPVPDRNEVQIQCSLRAQPTSTTSIRLFANGRLIAAFDDRGGFGPFNGILLGGVSLRRPMEAVFRSASLEMLTDGSTDPAPIARACDHLLATRSLEEDYRWMADSGLTRLNTVDFDTRQVNRIARELIRTSSTLRTDARAADLEQSGRRRLTQLAQRLSAQGQALDSLANPPIRSPADTGPAESALSCPAPELLLAPHRLTGGRPGVPARSTAWHRSAATRELDERLARILPAPAFVSDDASLPEEPDIPVDVDLSYQSFRVFGETMSEVNDSLRLNALHVEHELAAGLTTAEFETSYQPLDGASGCILVPQVSLKLVITLPEWRPPAGADRYLVNQWNQFMWDLDDHERHHADLWIKAANRMVIAINGTPPGLNCQQARALAKAHVDQVFKRFDRMQRRFDEDVATGRLPAPTFP